MSMMDYRCLRLIYLTKINYSYRFYSRNISRPKIRERNAPESNLNPTLIFGNQNYDSVNSVLPEQKTNLIAPQYKTLDEKNPRFKRTLNLVRSRKLRERKRKMILEGEILINDAIAVGMILKALYFYQEKVLEDMNYLKVKNVDFIKIPCRAMQLLSSSSPAVMGVFNRPSEIPKEMLPKPVMPVTLLCDNIRDPGNLGSIIRHAASAGCQSVLLLKGCVDPWETKVLKVGCGGHFRVPIINDIEWENIPNHISKQSKIYIADNASDIEQWDETPELISYDACPKEIEDGLAESAKKYLSLNEQISTTNELEDVNIPCYLYSSVMFPKENIVLYVGGETHGVDSRIIKLAVEYGGRKVKIPLENRMDSLNSSFSIAIILYEIKRQLSEKLL